MSQVLEVMQNLLRTLEERREETAIELAGIDAEIKRTEEAIALVNPPLQIENRTDDDVEMNTTERVFKIISTSDNGLSSMQVHARLKEMGDDVTTYDTVRSTVSRLVRQERLKPIFGTARYGVKENA